MEKKIFTVQSISKESDSVKIFLLAPDDGKNLQFKPGQFAMLHQFEGDAFGKLSRPYSIASSPKNGELRFVVKMTGGPFTSYMDGLKDGQKIGVSGPFGNFTYEGEGKVVCIAAGTGVAPMLGIIEHISLEKRPGSFAMFLSAKTEGELLCKTLLDSFAARHPSITVVYTLTREEPPGWEGEIGRIRAEMVNEFAPYAGEAKIFICGSMEFAKHMREMAIKLGADEKNVKIEAWG